MRRQATVRDTVLSGGRHANAGQGSKEHRPGHASTAPWVGAMTEGLGHSLGQPAAPKRQSRLERSVAANGMPSEEEEASPRQLSNGAVGLLGHDCVWNAMSRDWTWLTR